MKRCSSCGSISSDNENVCGVCRASLSSSSSIKNAPFIPEQRASKRGIAVVFGGIGATALGIVTLFLLGSRAPGISLIIALILVAGASVSFAGIGSLPIFKGVRGQMSLYRRRMKEEADERKRESGEAD